MSRRGWLQARESHRHRLGIAEHEAPARNENSSSGIRMVPNEIDVAQRIEGDAALFAGACRRRSDSATKPCAASCSVIAKMTGSAVTEMRMSRPRSGRHHALPASSAANRARPRRRSNGARCAWRSASPAASAALRAASVSGAAEAATSVISSIGRCSGGPRRNPPRARAARALADRAAERLHRQIVRHQHTRRSRC